MQTGLTIIYLVLDDEGFVIAEFVNTRDAQEFSSKHNMCMMPFNKANRAGELCPPVGTRYRA